MRIISGAYGGRRLKSLDGKTTRPTTDKVKESIFNIIGPYFDGGICLDLFAGSGGLSIEAVSRGMDKAILFERDRKAINVIKHNIEMTKEAKKFCVIHGDSQKRLIQIEKPVDLVFLDPPYATQTIQDDLLRLISFRLIKENTRIVCETDASVVLPDVIDILHKWKSVTYGSTTVSFYEVKK